MGFPNWTLWGMGLAALGALVSILLAFIAQTPRLLARLGLVGARLDLRARTFTGYGLAFLLLAGGFFLAGVPLGEAEPPATAAQLQEESQGIPATAAPDEPGAAAVPFDAAATPEAEAPLDEAETSGDAVTSGGSGSGMVVRPRETAEPETSDATAEPAAADAAATNEPEATPAATEIAAPAPAAEATPTATPTATPPPSPTSTPSPTTTPTPTMTPTPIDGATARVGENASALPVRDKPNGEPIATVYRGDTLLLLPGRAFHTGGLWREISTVDGVVGWVQDVFLDYGG